MEYDIISLWPSAQSSSDNSGQPNKSFITIHLPDTPGTPGTDRAAVIICPGGAYQHLAFDHEGVDCAAWLNGFGVAAFVLNYRIAPEHHHPEPLMDAQRALRLVRHNAKKWGIDKEKIGIWGFSAGGHLASTAATHYDAVDESSEDPIERESCRPSFTVLGYPVVTFTEPYTHMGSRINLIGENPDEDLIKNLSGELQVTPDTPPAFLMHTDADDAVPSENSVHFYLALRKAGVPAELHIFTNGPHGVGLAIDDPILSKWPGLLRNWLISMGIA